MTAPVQTRPAPDPSELLADIGDRIRCERRARGWTRTELGNRIGTTYGYVSRMEIGGTPLPLLVLARVCRVLGIQVSELLSEDWRVPAMPVRVKALSGMQVRVLRAGAAGGSLSEIAVRLGSTSRAVSARLSEAYRVLGVADLPQDERRAAAVRVAKERGFFDAA